PRVGRDRPGVCRLARSSHHHHHDQPLDAIPAPVAGAVAREVASSSIWPSAYGGPSGARPEAVSIVLPREFLVAIHVAASLRLGLDLRTFPDAPGNEHEAQSAHRARPTR